MPRKTIYNMKRQIDQAINDYRQERGIPHGIQKEAIQNSDDAKIDDKEWGIQFELIEDKKMSFFTITDFGTSGLEGPILSEDEVDKIVSEKGFIPKEFSWMRFEGHSFSKEGNEESTDKGSLGRGKFIFIGGSKERTVYYESVSKKEGYRLGWKYFDNYSLMNESKIGKDAHEFLKNEFKGLIQPNGHQGTRIIIPNPTEELVNSIISGEFTNFINETWWQLIQKNPGKIKVIYGGHTHIAQGVSLYSMETTDVYQIKRIKQHKNIGIEEICMGYDNFNKLEEIYQGLSLQRDNMKIMAYYPEKSEIAFISQAKNNIFGYVIFNKDIEMEIRNKYEDNTHYRINFREDLKKIQGVINKELEKFVFDDLGMGKMAKTIKSREEEKLYRKILEDINKIAKDIFEKPGIGPTTGKVKGETELKKIRIEMRQPTYADIPQRVDVGDSLNSMMWKTVNDTNLVLPISIKVVLVPFPENSKKPEESQIIQKFVEKELTLDKNGRDRDGPHEWKCPTLPKGRYCFSTSIEYLGEDRIKIDNDEFRKGSILFDHNHLFWIGQNPPAKGYFSDMEKSAFEGEDQKLRSMAGKGEEDKKILINIKHPQYEKIMELKERLRKERETEYLFECAIRVLAEKAIMDPSSKIFTENGRKDPGTALREMKFFIDGKLFDLLSVI